MICIYIYVCVYCMCILVYVCVYVCMYLPIGIYTNECSLIINNSNSILHNIVHVITSKLRYVFNSMV